MKRAFTLLLAGLIWTAAAFAGPDIATLSVRADQYRGTYDAVVLMEETDVKVAPSGMTEVLETRAIKMLNHSGCRDHHTVSFFYDPLTQIQEVTRASVIHANGDKTEIPLDTVRTYPQPARAIYWPNIRISIPFGLLNPGDVVTYTVRRKGFSYALLDEPAGEASDESRFQPPMKGQFYDIVHFQGFQPILYKQYSVELPQGKPIQYRFFHGEVTPMSEFTDYGMRYTFTKSDIEPVKREPHMVDISDVCAKLLISTTVSWKDKSEWFYGVNEDFAFNYTPEIKAKVDELVANCKTDDEKIDVLNHWVAHYIRYSGLTMGEGEGYTLHPADMNYTDRQGVCKDKASMLITFLRAAGFDAYPAMTMAGARIEDFPADHFNHCVVALRQDDGTFRMLDPTWVPWVREQWSSAEQEQQYLIGYKEGQPLKTTPYSPPEKHYYRIRSQFKLDKLGTLSGNIQISAEGQTDARIRRYTQGDYKSQADAYFISLITGTYPGAIVKNLKYQDPWDISKPMKITMDVEIPAFATVTPDGAVFRSLSLMLPREDPVNYELGGRWKAGERNYGFRTRCTKLITIDETIRLPESVNTALSTLPVVEPVTGEYADLRLSVQPEERAIHTMMTMTLKKRVYPAEAWNNVATVISDYQTSADSWFRIGYEEE